MRILAGRCASDHRHEPAFLAAKNARALRDELNGWLEARASDAFARSTWAPTTATHVRLAAALRRRGVHGEIIGSSRRQAQRPHAACSVAAQKAGGHAHRDRQAFVGRDVAKARRPLDALQTADRKNTLVKIESRAEIDVIRRRRSWLDASTSS